MKPITWSVQRLRSPLSSQLAAVRAQVNFVIWSELPLRPNLTKHFQPAQPIYESMESTNVNSRQRAQAFEEASAQHPWPTKS